MLKSRKGFTLIELLVVIGIIAVLAVVVVLTLNPAELLRQSRDSNRISDTGTLKSALSLYLADVTSPTGISNATSECQMTANATFATIVSWGINHGSSQGNASTTCGVFTSGATTTIYNGITSTARAVDGTGWVPVNLGAVSAGSPISQLPIDPINNGTFYYAYAASGTTLGFEIDAHMESTKYATTSATNVQNNDGGDAPFEFETGTILSI